MEAGYEKIVHQSFLLFDDCIYFDSSDFLWIILVSFLYFIPSQILYRRRLREKLSEDRQ